MARRLPQCRQRQFPGEREAGMPEPIEIEILDGGAALAMRFPDGGRRRFHAVWLRDNAWDEATRAPGNGQRRITLADIPANTRIAEARFEAGQLQVRFQPEDRTIAYDASWLAEHAYDRPEPRSLGW